MFDIRVYGIIEKFLFRLEDQGVHFIPPNVIVIHIFFIVKFVKVSTNVFIEWLDVLIVVSSANMSAQVLVSERGRSIT